MVKSAHECQVKFKSQCQQWPPARSPVDILGEARPTCLCQLQIMSFTGTETTHEVTHVTTNDPAWHATGNSCGYIHVCTRSTGIGILNAPVTFAGQEDEAQRVALSECY